MSGKNVGHVLWTDLTVDNAEDVRAFYQDVIGWDSEAVKMEDRTDFSMTTYDERPSVSDKAPHVITGICNRVGELADFPPQWIIYFGVANLDESLAAVEKHKGKKVTKVAAMGKSRYCVVQDPAGAVCGLFENNPQD